MPWESIEAWQVLSVVAAVFAMMFTVDAIFGDDIEDAVERTSSRFWGIILGSLSGVAGAAMGLLGPLAELPGLVVAMLGVGGIIAGISWEMFAATSLLTWTFLKAWTMRG